MTTPLYSLTYFLVQCKEQGFSVGNKNTYLKYERSGVFLKGKFSFMVGKGVVRVFTQEEMQKNIERYKQWKSGALHTP